jgi:hypothetical protein
VRTATLYATPSLLAPAVGLLLDQATVTAEEFLLTDPGTLRIATGTPGNGAGWYRLSAPLEGWVPARFLSNTSVDESLNLPLCAWRNALNPVR